MGSPSPDSLFLKAREGDVGIIGDPLDHSLSPLMHNAAFKTWWGAFRDKDERTPVYHKFQVGPDDLAKAVQLVKQKKLRGVNVTVPYKTTIVGLLDDIDSFAERTGSVNTLVVKNGKIKGFNTDGSGFRKSLESDLNFNPNGKQALVLGAGGTGRTIVRTLVENQAHVRWWNRTPAKMNRAVDEWGDNGTIMLVDDAKMLSKACSDADLIVNTTSAGLSPEDGMPADGLSFNPGHTVFDVIYHRETRFMQEAKMAGAHVVGGLGMLIYQGAASFELWTGAPAPREVMWAALSNTIKKEREN